MTSPWVGGVGSAATSTTKRVRSFAEIIADEERNRNILELVLNKIEKVDSEGKTFKHRNLTFDEIGSFLFDTLKISSNECLRFNYATGRRYDIREIMFKPGVDIGPYIMKNCIMKKICIICYRLMQCITLYDTIG